MTLQQFQKLFDAQPFRPFVVHLADGRSIAIVHREFFSTRPEGRTVTVYQLDGTLNIIDLLLVTDLEVPPSNGQPDGRDIND